MGTIQILREFFTEDVKVGLILLFVIWTISIAFIFRYILSYNHYYSEYSEFWVVDFSKGRIYDHLGWKKILLMCIFAPITLLLIGIVIVDEH